MGGEGGGGRSRFKMGRIPSHTLSESSKEAVHMVERAQVWGSSLTRIQILVTLLADLREVSETHCLFPHL